MVVLMIDPKTGLQRATYSVTNVRSHTNFCQTPSIPLTQPPCRLRPFFARYVFSYN